jgi:hypothetical protein
MAALRRPDPNLGLPGMMPSEYNVWPAERTQKKPAAPPIQANPEPQAPPVEIYRPRPGLDDVETAAAAPGPDPLIMAYPRSASTRSAGASAASVVPVPLYTYPQVSTPALCPLPCAILEAPIAAVREWLKVGEPSRGVCSQLEKMSMQSANGGLKAIALKLRDALADATLSTTPLNLHVQQELLIRWILDGQVALARAAGVEATLEQLGLPDDDGQSGRNHAVRYPV